MNFSMCREIFYPQLETIQHRYLFLFPQIQFFVKVNIFKICAFLLEKEMATHSSILAWRTPWTEEPGGPQSMELQRVGHG